MEALKLAFDTIIVGALALPWLILLIDVFLRPKDEKASTWSLFLSFLVPFKDNDTAVLAAAGVFVFAATYFVGAAITRVSGDFFNDDDLWIPYVRLPTEDNIRTDVYCDPVVRELARAGGQDGMTTDRCQKAAGVKTWRLWRSGKVEKRSDLYCDNCEYSIAIIDRGEAERARKDIQRTFYRQGAALLAPTNNSDRLNQLHSQNLVLRGAAFNGVIAALLSFFAWCGQPGRRRLWWAFPIMLFTAGLLILFLIHNRQHGLDDPPFMEFTAIVLGAVGMGIRLWGSPKQNHYLYWVGTASLLTLVAGFGWWWSEVLYDRLVLYSFYATTVK
jgi:hypothetical protein